MKKENQLANHQKSRWKVRIYADKNADFSERGLKG